MPRHSAGVLAMGQSTLYPLLYNLQAKGLIKARWETQSSGRRRKYYRLTDRGQRRLAEDTEQWQAIARAMAALGIITQPAAERSAMAGGLA